MIRKSGNRFCEKIMLKQDAGGRRRFEEKSSRSSVIHRFLTTACAGLVLVLVATQAHAQSAKTVTLVVPYAAGGGTDTVARLIAERMSRALGQTVIIENQVGGGSTVANDRVARSAPDGATILINHVGLLAAPNLFTNLRYDTMTAFEPVGLVNLAPMLLIGRKTIPGSTPRSSAQSGCCTGCAGQSPTAKNPCS